MHPEKGKEQYRECMRNHAATLGTYAVDGCGEYTPDPSAPEACSYVAVGETGGGGAGGDSFMVGFSPPSASDERNDGKKRTRTKFSSEQKEQMLQFAEKIGWKVQRKDGGQDEIASFCREIGITRQMFKVWIHNHKGSSTSSSTTTGTNTTATD
ncbi:unnamed protein product [Spirodela intermedia]|uniref:ZF-HD dimerization-type domain-containing protein n=1 Tax=Spirodela intermedia TaxID=51605 RepID=A0A7I8J3A4_SPIIN|nr:unnamed protein product [Spirodela intermedia]CAA6664738.1 unnamed protein product [Spirodela intermedia]